MERQNQNNPNEQSNARQPKPGRKDAPGREQRQPVAGNDKSNKGRTGKSNISNIDQQKDRE